MNQSRYLRTALALSLAGLLFAGYLSGIKLITKTCAFNEPCPTFLGYPACWYGFAMYAIMTVATFIAWRKSNLGSAAYTNLIVSGVGILFAGQYAVPEIAAIVRGEGVVYSLGLPTCVYGLIFYIAIFLVSLVAIRKKNLA